MWTYFRIMVCSVPLTAVLLTVYLGDDGVKIDTIHAK